MEYMTYEDAEREAEMLGNTDPNLDAKQQMLVDFYFHGNKLEVHSHKEHPDSYMGVPYMGRYGLG